MASRRRHVASSGTPRVPGERIGNIPATGATTFVVLTGDPLQQFIVIELAKKFNEFSNYSSHHRVYKSLALRPILRQFSLRNSSMLFYY